MQELQELGFDLSMTGFDEKELTDLLGADAGSEAKEDDFDLSAALEKAAFVRRGDIWTVGRHKLMCGDATSAEDVSRLKEYGMRKRIIRKYSSTATMTLTELQACRYFCVISCQRV